MGIAWRTTYGIIIKIEEEKSLERSKESERKSRKMTKGKIKKLEDVDICKIGQSCKKLRRKFRISHEYIRKIFEKRNIKIRKRKFAPKYSVKQLQNQKSLLRKLRDGPFKPSNQLSVIIDDGSYFTLDGTDCACNNTYYYKEESKEDFEVNLQNRNGFLL